MGNFLYFPYCSPIIPIIQISNIRPSIAIIRNIRFLNRIFGRVFRLFIFYFFFLRKNIPIIAIIPNIRFLNRIFGRVFRLFIFYFLIIFGFLTEYSTEIFDYFFLSNDYLINYKRLVLKATL